MWFPGGQDGAVVVWRSVALTMWRSVERECGRGSVGRQVSQGALGRSDAGRGLCPQPSNSAPQCPHSLHYLNTAPTALTPLPPLPHVKHQCPCPRYSLLPQQLCGFLFDPGTTIALTHPSVSHYHSVKPNQTQDIKACQSWCFHSSQLVKEVDT